jgi:hypothetical protein
MIDEIKHEVMVNFLFQQQCSSLWIGDDSGELEGVLLRKSMGVYLSCPPQLVETLFGRACLALNVQVSNPHSLRSTNINNCVKVALTVNSRIIKTFLQHSPEAVDVPLPNGLRIQILPTIADLVNARKSQFAAFVASEHLLVVWDDEASNVIPRAKAVEKELMDLVWRTGKAEDVDEDDVAAAKKGPAVVDTEINEETGEFVSKRPTNIQNSALVGLTMLIITIMLGAGFREIAIEVAVDHGWQRLAFLSLTPVQIFFTLVSLASNPTCQWPSLPSCSSLLKLSSAASHSVWDPLSK